jgi:hypothetical protein
MRLIDRYEQAYKRAFAERLFEGSLGLRISPEQARRYCPDRFDAQGRALDPFKHELDLLDMLTDSNGLRRIFVTGDAGCGKSTYLRFVFDFFRYYSEGIRVLGFEEWLRRHPTIESCNPEESSLLVLGVLPEESQTVEHSVAKVCAQIRQQLMVTYPALLTEDDWACVRLIVGMKECPDDEQITLLKQRANALHIDDEKAVDFCKAAFQYLRFVRRPASERPHLVLVIDDTDLMEAGHVCDVELSLENLVVDLEGSDTGCVPLSFIHSARPDTYDMRYEQHVGLPSSDRIDLGRVVSVRDKHH